MGKHQLQIVGQMEILFLTTLSIMKLFSQVNDMNGKFVIPKLKKVRHLHVVEEEE